MDMRIRRFFAAFLCVCLLMALFATPAALADNEKELEAFDLQARAGVLIDRNTGAVLYAKDEHKELYPASTTKIMTALLVLRAVDAGTLSLEQSVTATASALSHQEPGGSTANIQEGETLTVKELLQCMLIVSANEACNILAETVSGSVEAFVEEMNAAAQELRCANTHFTNTSGLQDPQHYTSAWDLALITQEALKYDVFMEICDCIKAVIPATNLSGERVLRTTNYLLDTWRAVGYRYKNAHGIKTGSTSDAGYCLVSSAAKGELNLLSVVLGAERVGTDNGGFRTQSFSETSRMFEWGFDNFSYKTILSENDMLASLPVALSKETNSVVLHPAGDVTALLPNSLSGSDLKRTIRFSKEEVEAPVSAGDILAEVVLSYGDTTYATVSLVALNDVAASRSLALLRQVERFFDSLLVRIIAVLVLLLIAALVVWKLTIGRRRYRYGKKVTRSRTYRGRKRIR